MLKNIWKKLLQYSFKQLVVRFAEEYLWWIFKNWPGFEGVVFRYLFLKCTSKKLEGFCWISKGCTIVNGYNISIGKNFAVNVNVLMDGMGGIQIGHQTGIGPNSVLISQGHSMLSQYGFVGGESHKNSKLKAINIGSKVWVGANCFIMGGINIGDSSVVGACSNVVCDLPQKSMVIGSPAKPYFEVMRDVVKPK